MSTSNRLLVTVLVAGLLPIYSSTSLAYDPVEQQTFGQSYGEKVGGKALNGFANLTTGIVEIPKNIIQTTNESNIFYGLVGGMFKGMIHTAGRMGVGLTDLLTAPLPTLRVVHPNYVWDDFYTETTYGDIFRPDNSRPVRPAMVLTPPAPQPVNAVVAPTASTVDQAPVYNNNTNKKLDRIFKKKMMK